MTTNTKPPQSAATKELGAGWLVLGLVVLILLVWAGRSLDLIDAPPPSTPKEATAFDLHAQNSFKCNADSMPANSNVAQISAHFYHDGTALILSGEIRNDAEWEPHGAGLRYRSLKVANNAGGVMVDNPTWFNIDRAVVLGKKGDKSLVRLEGYETLYCISEFR